MTTFEVTVNFQGSVTYKVNAQTRRGACKMAANRFNDVRLSGVDKTGIREEIYIQNDPIFITGVERRAK